MSRSSTSTGSGTSPRSGRWDMVPAAGPLHVAVADQLPGLAHGEREAQAEAHGVQPGLQLADQFLAGHTLAAGGTIEVPAELALAHAVDGAELLLLHQPHLVLREALAPTAVLARRIGPLARRAIGPSAHGRADAPAHLVSRSDLLHEPVQGTQPIAAVTKGWRVAETRILHIRDSVPTHATRGAGDGEHGGHAGRIGGHGRDRARAAGRRRGAGPGAARTDPKEDVMRVFVAGAGGVLGRRLVPQLIEAGHEVTGMTRRQERAEAIRAQGAEAVVCDVFEAEPDVVVHELTDIPPAINVRKYAEVMAGNDRIRIEGTRNLVAAARAAGARRLVAQSIAFAYAPVEGPVKDEDDPLYLDAGEPLGPTMQAVADLERQTLGAEGIEGLVLRYGYLYGPGTTYAPEGDTAARVRRHRFPVVGTGTGVFSFIHVEDRKSVV